MKLNDNDKSLGLEAWSEDKVRPRAEVSELSGASKVEQALGLEVWSDCTKSPGPKLRSSVEYEPSDSGRIRVE